MKAKREPIDFLADQFKTQNTTKRDPIDFLEEESPESLITSAFYASPRIATDLAKSGYNFVTKTLPAAYQSAKTEVPAFLNPMEVVRHPLHRAGQVLAGALEGGQAINRLPRNIVDYAVNRLHLLPEEWAGKFPVGHDITPAIQNTFGEPQYPGEALGRGIGGNVLNLMTLTSLLNRIPHFTRKGGAKKLNILENQMNALKDLEGNENVNLYHGTSEDFANKILENGLTPKRHAQDYATLTNSAPAGLEYGARVSEEPDLLRITMPRSEINNYLHPQNTGNFIAPRGHESAQIFGTKQPIPPKYISKVGYHDLDLINEPHNVTEKMKIPAALDVNPQLIEDTRKYFPDDTAYRDLVDAAHTGDYSKLFKLQSDLGKISRKRQRDFMSAQREKGRAGVNAANALLDDMHKDMIKKGMLEQSELLRQGRNDYRRYMKFKPYRNALLGLAAYLMIPKSKIAETAKNFVLRKFE